MYANPVVTGNLLYVGSCSGYVFALNLETGKKEWEYYAGDRSFHGDPLYNDSVLFIPSDWPPFKNDASPIYALHLLTGKLIWKTDMIGLSELGYGVTTGLIKTSHGIQGVTTQDELVCLSASDGAIRWKFRTKYDTTLSYWNSDPVASGDTVYFAGQDGIVYALNSLDGVVLWKRDIGSPVSTSAVFSSGAIYFGTSDGSIHRIWLGGEKQVSKKVNGTPGFKMSCTNDAIFFLTAKNEGDYVMKTVHAYDLSLDNQLWELQARNNANWSIKKAYPYRDYVIVGDSKGGVYFLESRSGKIVYSFQLEGQIRSLDYDNEMLYIGTINGIVYAVSCKGLD